MGSGKVLYPLLGVGSFVLLFWIGVSVGQSLGLPILAMLAVGLVSGAAAVALVVQLERQDLER